MFWKQWKRKNVSRHPWRKLDIKSLKVKSRPHFGSPSSKATAAATTNKLPNIALILKCAPPVPVRQLVSLPASHLHTDSCPLLCYAEDNLLRFTNSLTDMMKLRAFVLAEVIGGVSGDPATRSSECTGLAPVAGLGRHCTYRPANQPRRLPRGSPPLLYDEPATVYEYDFISVVFLISTHNIVCEGKCTSRYYCFIRGNCCSCIHYVISKYSIIKVRCESILVKVEEVSW